MTTFGQLKTDTDSFLARDDIATSPNDIAAITRLAEAEIAREVRVMAMERNTTLAAAGRQTVAPARFLEARYLGLDSNKQPRIEYMTPEVIRKEPAWSSGSTISFYTIEGLIGNEDETLNDVYFTWAPAGSVATPTDVELGYFARWLAFDQDPDTNWLLTEHYDIYLWAMLKAAGIFLQEEGLINRYGSEFVAAKSALAKAENRKRFRGQTKKAYNSPRVIV